MFLFIDLVFVVSLINDVNYCLKTDVCYCFQPEEDYVDLKYGNILSPETQKQLSLGGYGEGDSKSLSFSRIWSFTTPKTLKVFFNSRHISTCRLLLSAVFNVKKKGLHNI